MKSRLILILIRIVIDKVIGCGSYRDRIIFYKRRPRAKTKIGYPIWIKICMSSTFILLLREHLKNVQKNFYRFYLRDAFLSSFVYFLISSHASVFNLYIKSQQKLIEIKLRTHIYKHNRDCNHHTHTQHTVLFH